MSLQSNRILSKISRSDLDRLEPHLEELDLPLRFRMEERGRPIEYVYFPTTGIASVVARSPKGAEIEVGLIGFEGMTGFSVAMGKPNAPHATFMQVGGTGLRLPVEAFVSALEVSQTLSRIVLQYTHSFFVQTSFTALSNGHSTLAERLARWLLMAQDRVLSNELPLTHEFLSIMLGVRRPGVTSGIRALMDAGLIETKRGAITVLDRAGLLRAANGAYVRGDEME